MNATRLKEDFKNLALKEGMYIPSDIVEELLCWTEMYEYNIIIDDDAIILDDLQTSNTMTRYTMREFLMHWKSILESKYDFTPGSLDSEVCGESFIKEVLSLVNGIGAIVS